MRIPNEGAAVSTALRDGGRQELDSGRSAPSVFLYAHFEFLFADAFSVLKLEWSPDGSYLLLMDKVR